VAWWWRTQYRRREKNDMGRLKAVWEKYLWCLEKKPLLTKSLTSAAMGGIGDIIAQLLVPYVFGGVSGFDLVRWIRFVFLNLVFVGPVCHAWLTILVKRMPKPGLKWAVLRMIPDQILFTPIFNFLLLSLLFSMTDLVPQWASAAALWSTLKAGWCLWPAAQILNFWVVPPPLQQLYINFVALAWNTYLSTRAASGML